jgi:hypothetical protein
VARRRPAKTEPVLTSCGRVVAGRCLGAGSQGTSFGRRLRLKTAELALPFAVGYEAFERALWEAELPGRA